jgi:hypothetical protein
LIRRSQARGRTVLIGALVVAAGALVAWQYLGGAPVYPSFEAVLHDETATAGGYTLFAPTVDDIGGELGPPNDVYLVDIHGSIVHTWQVPGSVQLVRLRPDGNLLYATRDRSFPERAGVRELDPFSNVVWYHKMAADHDFHLLDDGNLLVNTIEDVEAPQIGPGPIRCPRIVELTRDHRIVWEWRAEEHVEELTELVGIPFPLDREGDKLHNWAHNNTVQVIGANAAAEVDPRFRPGNLLFSYCNLNTIGVIDRDSGRIVWAWGPGELDGQHNPQMVPDGRILIFDNGSERGFSRVIELDPLSGTVVWQYDDRDAEAPRFYSRYISGAQRLANGNVFVCQGADRRTVPPGPRGWRERLRRRRAPGPVVGSRLFEVDRSGKLVWDCSLTFSGENTYGVYQAVRYSDAYVAPLLRRLEELDPDSRQLESLPYVR